jgi:C-terminal processing protease CtpA/Prc
MLRYSILLSALLLCGSAYGQITTISATDLQKDVAVLRRAYETLHPGLYRYNSKAEMDARFDALAARLNRDQSLREAYLAFSEFAATVKCGHSYANFFNQTKPVTAELFETQTRVPFYFEWIDGRMVVTRDFTPGQILPRGTRVRAINANSSADILSKLMTIARADGSNDSKRVAMLAVNGDSIYETFDIFFPLIFPQRSPQMRLSIQKPDATKTESIEVEALTYEQRIAPIKAREANKKGGDQVLFEWKYLKDGAAYLKMPDWSLYDSKWDWKAWLNGHLDDAIARKAPSLIVDLRGNEGGIDAGNPILSRLVTKDLPITSLRRLVRYRKVPDDLAPYLDTWDPSFKDWGDAAVELAKPWPTAPSTVPYLLLKRYDDDAAGDVIKAEGKHYPGKVFVLVDANNSSATFQFAQIVQQNKLGILVGAPTGGSQRGINGGAFFFLRLPGSKIEMDLPLIATFPPKEMPDTGLTPDVLVQASEGDIARGKDLVLAAVSP